MQRFFIGIFCALLLFSCSGNRNNFTLEVQADGSKGEMLYLAKRTLEGTFMVDSTLPDKSGKYTLEGRAEIPDFYILYSNPRRFINLIIHPGDEFRVLTHMPDFDVNYIIEGSKDSRLIQKLINQQTRTLEQITGLTERYESSRGAEDFKQISHEIDSSYDQVFNAHKAFSINLIRENPESLASLMSLYQQLGRNTPVFDYRKDLEYYELVDSSLGRLYPNNEAVIDLNRKVSELREILHLEIGATAPDITLPDSTGTVISLSSLRGHNVMLIFWASWSSLSVDKINELAAIKGIPDLQFYTVSLDRTQSSWLRGVNRLKVNGIHVSDLKYWDSPVAELYHIEKLPVTYLLDKKGIIKARDIDPDSFQWIETP